MFRFQFFPSFVRAFYKRPSIIYWNYPYVVIGQAKEPLNDFNFKIKCRTKDDATDIVNKLTNVMQKSNEPVTKEHTTNE